MGQIAASDDRDIPVQKFRRLPDALSQFIMYGQGQTGQADPDQPVISVILIQKPERHHGPVIQIRIPFPQRAGRDISRFRLLLQKSRKLCIIFCPELYLGRTETGKISRCSFSRGNVEIICIHHGMR